MVPAHKKVGIKKKAVEEEEEITSHRRSLFFSYSYSSVAR